MTSLPHTYGEPPRLPLAVALSVIPSLPRPLLKRFVERAIERLDDTDIDPDLEPDDEPEDGHDAEIEEGEAAGHYGIDQREVRHWGGRWREP